MTPREFLAEVVRPNVSEFYANLASLRHAFNAVLAVDTLAAYIFIWCASHRLEEFQDIKDAQRPGCVRLAARCR
jgi:hypothetical protein